MTHTHAIATNLVGFPSSTLRVRITRTDEPSGCVWVTTADLQDVGTELVLDASQVTQEPSEAVVAGLRHRSGLVVIA